MKTGELFAEQVLIGAIILAICTVPWAREISEFNLGKINDIVGLAGSAAAIGFCFLIGIVFDRLADTLTDRLERYHRLSFGLRKLNQQNGAKRLAISKDDWRDPFDERAFKLKLLRDKDPVVDWANYHRSRMRLSRALAVYMPGLSLALTIGAIRFLITCPIMPLLFSLPAWLFMIPLIYVVAIGFLGVCKPIPKTNDKTGAAFNYAKANYLMDCTPGAEMRRRKSLHLLIMTDPFVIGGTSLLLLSIAISIAALNPVLMIISTGIALLTILSGWSWWRISSTYFDFLHQIGESKDIESD